MLAAGTVGGIHLVGHATDDFIHTNGVSQYHVETEMTFGSCAPSHLLTTAIAPGYSITQGPSSDYDREGNHIECGWRYPVEFRCILCAHDAWQDHWGMGTSAWCDYGTYDGQFKGGWCVSIPIGHQDIMTVVAEIPPVGPGQSVLVDLTSL